MQQNATQPAPPARPAPQPRPSPLSRVVRGRLERPDRTLLYGPEGIGKSTFGADAERPIFICAEDGTSKLNVDRLPPPQRYEDVLEYVRALTHEQHDYRTLVVDTLDWLEALLWSYICERDRKKSIEDYGYGKGLVAAVDEWRVFIARLEGLRTAKGMHVMLLAHSQIKPFKNPTGDDYDRYQLKMDARAGGLLKEWCDDVLFAYEETFADTKEKNGKTKTIGISTGTRVLSTIRTAAWDAKNRSGLPPRLPLSFADYAAAKLAGQPEAPDRLAAQVEALLVEIADETLAAKVRDAVVAANGNAIDLSKIVNRLNAIRSERAAKGA